MKNSQFDRTLRYIRDHAEPTKLILTLINLTRQNTLFLTCLLMICPFLNARHSSEYHYFQSKHNLSICTSYMISCLHTPLYFTWKKNFKLKNHLLDILFKTAFSFKILGMSQWNCRQNMMICKTVRLPQDCRVWHNTVVTDCETKCQVRNNDELS